MNAAIKTLPLPKIKRNKIVPLLSTQHKYLSILNEQLKKKIHSFIMKTCFRFAYALCSFH